METGTMDATLLQDHSIEAEGTLNMTAGVTTSGATECKSVVLSLGSRSGDEVKEGGHMVAASIGQVMLSSTRATPSLAIPTSGITHIVPMTWQNTKKSNSEAACSVCER